MEVGVGSVWQFGNPNRCPRSGLNSSASSWTKCAYAAVWLRAAPTPWTQRALPVPVCKRDGVVQGNDTGRSVGWLCVRSGAGLGPGQQRLLGEHGRGGEDGWSLFLPAQEPGALNGADRLWL